MHTDYLGVAPTQKPTRPFFSSGPCAKHPGWSGKRLEHALLGRSHRSTAGKERLLNCVRRLQHTLEIPPEYLVAITPGSTTGAMEMALWSLLGPCDIDVWSWDVFGAIWAQDILHQLKLTHAHHYTAPFGSLPDLSKAQAHRDQVFTWCGTTAGVWVPQGASWISPQRTGLTFCDATSAVFGTHLPWPLLDVTAFSWQKGLGSEAAHGTLVLSPRAVERLKTHTPSWPIPRALNMRGPNGFNPAFFEGETINTPSLLCVEDCLSALDWVDSIGGLNACVARTQKNFSLLAEWVNRTPWIDFVAKKSDIRSHTAVCLAIQDQTFLSLSEDGKRDFIQRMATILAQEEAAFEIANHRRMPPSLRIWCGPTIEADDLKLLFPWIDWAFMTIKNMSA